MARTMESPSGRSYLSSYTIVTEIATGSYGTIWKVRFTATGEICALKRPPKKYLHFKDAKKAPPGLPSDILHALLREKAVAESVGAHPHLVRLCYTGVDTQGYPMLFYQWAGRNLMRTLCDGVQINIERIIKGVASAMAHLHIHGYYHHDIKCENILIDEEDGTVRVCDYGLGSSGAVVVCSIPYRAPEAIMRRHATHPEAVDLWSMGVLFYYLATSSWLVPYDLWHNMSSSSNEDAVKILPYLVGCINAPGALLPEYYPKHLGDVPCCEKARATFLANLHKLPRKLADLIYRLLSLNMHKRPRAFDVCVLADLIEFVVPFSMASLSASLTTIG